MIYSFVMLGPWGGIKMAAYSIGSPAWLLYALALVAVVLIVLPGLLYLGLGLANPGMKASQLKREFIHQSYALVPAGLAAWIAFSLSFIFTNFSYVFSGLSDPFGWGWNLLGTAGMAWTPYFSNAIPFLQVLVLLAGLGATVYSSNKIAQEGLQSRSSLPLIGLSTALTVGQLWILIG